MILLYDYVLSGDCYKVRLLLAMLGLEYSVRHVDFYPGCEQRSAWFLAINPLGQLPVLDDDGLVLRDAHAILTYLAVKYDGSGQWYPRDSAPTIGNVAMWLSFAQGITETVSAARLHDTMLSDLDVIKARKGAHGLFRVLEEHLWFAEQEGSDWICNWSHPTIADIACFPYIVLSEEGGISRQNYSAIRRWTDRVKNLPRFVLAPGIFATAPRA